MAAAGPQPPSSTPPSGPSRTAAAPRGGAGQGLQKVWQTRGMAAWALWPVSLVYRVLVALRRALYRTGVLASDHPGRPVVVVGNVIAGGAGKTPVVLALVKHLQARGLRPGVISRGYGRRAGDCRAVTPHSLPADVGDEPALIARSLAGGPAVPVFVAPRRLAAARALLAAHPETDVIVCDDGLQHLALRRDLEVCVFNDQGVGNGFLLPAGPLREPWPRAVDWVLYARSAPAQAPCPSHGRDMPDKFDMPDMHGIQRTEGTHSSPSSFVLRRSLASYALRSDGTQVPLARLQGQPLHAIAAVARPGDFFTMLRAQRLTLEHTEALPDHYDFSSWKGMTSKRNQLICTEKDAVKLWPLQPDALAVPLVLEIDPRFFEALDQRLRPLLPPTSASAPLSSQLD